MKKEHDLAWHTLASEQVVNHWQTHPEQGLDRALVTKRLEDFGLNELPPEKERRWWEIFASQLSDFMIWVLLFAAFISALMGEYTDVVVILAIVIANAVIGAHQELKSQSSLRALKKMDRTMASSIRQGSRQEIEAKQVVPGDVVLVEAGDIVPADLRWLDTQGLHIDESPLTGESAPIAKEADLLHPADTYLAERTNLGFKGTRVTKGRGKAVVVATGSQTEFGKIAHTIQNAGPSVTPLQSQMHSFGKKLTLVLVLLCVVVFFEGLFRGGEIREMLLTAIGLAVAAIPESLPAVVTLALSLGAMRLARHRALVRKLSAVEGLGSVSLICTDKTGTLTQNIMVVEKFWAAPGMEEHLIKATFLNNDVHRSVKGELVGDPMEIALFRWALERKVQEKELAKASPRVFELPFDSERKLMTTVHKQSEGLVVYCKGAPESLTPRLVKNLITPERETEMDKQANQWAKEGLRILAYGMKITKSLPAVDDQSLHSWESDFQILGILALMDPPRLEAQDALNFCKKAGVKVVMITGDHPLTAKAIAERLKISDQNDEVFSGKDLEAIDDETLLGRLARIKIFARVSPAQKLRLVKVYKQQGEFVAMTGDGVNDAPALKEADIGVSMGLSGTEVAKEASDVTLLDDNFATLVEAIKEGRKIFDNLKKFLIFALSGNFGEILTLFVAPWFWPQMPLLPIHILWVNLVTDGFPGLALANEEGDQSSWWKKPEGRKRLVLSKKDWAIVMGLGTILSICTLLGFYLNLDQGIAYARTVAFSILTFGQLFMCLGMRTSRPLMTSFQSREDFTLPLVVLACSLVQFAVMFTEIGRTWMKLAPLHWDALPEIALSLVPLVIWETKKLWQKKLTEFERFEE